MTSPWNPPLDETAFPPFRVLARLEQGESGLIVTRLRGRCSSFLNRSV